MLEQVKAALQKERYLPVRYMSTVGFAVGVYEGAVGPMVLIETGKATIYARADLVGPVSTRLG